MNIFAAILCVLAVWEIVVEFSFIAKTITVCIIERIFFENKSLPWKCASFRKFCKLKQNLTFFMEHRSFSFSCVFVCKNVILWHFMVSWLQGHVLVFFFFHVLSDSCLRILVFHSFGCIPKGAVILSKDYPKLPNSIGKHSTANIPVFLAKSLLQHRLESLPENHQPTLPPQTQLIKRGQSFWESFKKLHSHRF